MLPVLKKFNHRAGLAKIVEFYSSIFGADSDMISGERAEMRSGVG